MKERNSTFELLRIIAITFIMIHHVIVFGLGGCNYGLELSQYQGVYLDYYQYIYVSSFLL